MKYWIKWLFVPMVRLAASFTTFYSPFDRRFFFTQKESIAGISFFLLVFLQACTTPQSQMSDINQDIDRIDNRVQTFNRNQQESISRKKSLFSQIDELISTQPHLIVKDQESTTNAIASNPEQDTNTVSSSLHAENLPVNAPGSNKEADELYRNAYDSYNKGEYDKAVESFLLAFQYTTNEDLKARCVYGVGECHYRMQEWIKAIHCFTRFENLYGNHPLLPSALLKKGCAYVYTGDLQKGKSTLQLLIDRYPAAKETPLARERLRELGAI